MAVPPPPKDAHVQVWVLPGQTPPYRIASKDLPIVDGVLIFKNNHFPGFFVYFDLQDDTHGYLFPPNPQKAEAVWSQLGANSCPNSAGNPKDCVFEPISVDPTRRSLKVRNPNVDPVLGAFGYTLRVVDGGGNWLNLDPGGDNQNGPVSFNWGVLFVAAVAVAAIAVFALYELGFFAHQ